MPLNNHVILITGAGGGLGSTAALALAQQGATIILLDKSIPKLEAIYDAIKASGAPEPILYPFDLAGASEDEYQELADKIQEKYGSLQGLLHSAVEFSGFTPLSVQSLKDWQQTITVNLNAPFLLSRMLLPVLQKSDTATIVFTTDSAVRSAVAYSGAYGTAKVAMEALAKMLADELESFHKIRVNVFIPGPVNSPLRTRVFPAEDKATLPKMESLSAAYLYLFGAQSIGVTGQMIDARTFHI